MSIKSKRKKKSMISTPQMDPPNITNTNLLLEVQFKTRSIKH